MKTRTLYTEYVGENKRSKKKISYARVFATDKVFTVEYPVSIVLPVSDLWITDWYTAEDNYLTARGIK